LLERAIQQKQWQTDIAIAPDRPSLNFLASYGTQALEREDMFHANADFYSYGLALTIPLFSGFSTMAKKREYREQVYQTERTFEIEKRNLRERIRNAIANVTRLHKQYQNLLAVTKSSQRALDLVNGGFRQGTTTPQDVVNFQSNRYQAEKVLIDIQFSYLKSVADLRELMGVDLLRIYGEKAGES
jgi:outer membrane protein